MASIVKQQGAIGFRKPMVSLVIPTLNEMKNLPLVLPYIPVDVVDEVILVDGFSTDHTVTVAKQLLPSVIVVQEPREGKGAALARGFHEAMGDIIIVLDADGSHDPREIPRFIQPLLEGADFVKGSRFAPTGGTTDMPRLRKLGNWGFVQLTNLLFSQSFTDLCYGYHAFWRHCLDYIDLERANGFEVDTAIYLQAVRSRLKVVDVPSFEGFRFYGVGKLKTFPDGWRVLRTIFREWAAGLRQPRKPGKVGFRSYGRSPLAQVEPLVPVTGGQVELAATETAVGEDLANHQRLDLDALLRVAASEQLPAQDRDRLLSEALLWIIEGLGASSGSLLLLGGSTQVSGGYLVFGRRIEPAPRRTLEEAVTMGVASQVIRTRQPLIIASTREDPRWMKRPWEIQEDSSRSVLVFPLCANQHVRGVLTLARPHDRVFTAEDVDWLKTFTISV